MVGIVLFEIETIHHIKTCYSETKKSQKIVNILFIIVYLVYGRNTLVIRNTFKKYGNAGVDFKNTLIVFGVSIVAIFLFVLFFCLLYYKFKETTTFKDSFVKNKNIFIIAIIIVLTVSIITGYGSIKGDISSSGQSDVIELVEADGFELTDEGVSIGYIIKNNSPSTIYRINHCKFSFTDSEGNVLAEKEFENLGFKNGALESKSEGVVLLYFSFPNEANEKLWKETEQFSVTTTISDIVLH